MYTRSTRAARFIPAAAVVSMLVVAAACNSIDRSTAPSARARAGALTPSGEVFVPVGPIIPCVDSIFKGDFSSDAVSAYPGAPTIGSWTGYQYAGTIRVRSSVGWLFSKPVELTQYAGFTGGVSLSGKIRCTGAPSSGIVVVDWRSLVHSSTVSFAAIALRDDLSRVLAAVEYRPNGVVTYNGITVPGVTWVKDVPRQFRIRLDLTGRKSSLYVDGQLKLVGVGYFETSATNLWRVSMELGGTSAQSFAWDDILAVRYAW